MAPSGLERWMPVDGRETPLSAAGGQRAHTFRSPRRDLKGSVASSVSVSLRACFSKVGHSAFV